MRDKIIDEIIEDYLKTENLHQFFARINGRMWELQPKKPIEEIKDKNDKHI